tara:strand:- start:2 stop:184 length:183 start_codon:yes stop_codon:yes gene_type:complete
VRATNTTWACAKKKNLVGVPSVIEVVSGNYDRSAKSLLFFDCIQNQGTRNDIEAVDWFVK